MKFSSAILVLCYTLLLQQQQQKYSFTKADIYYENELIKPAEIFDTLTLLDSPVDWQTTNTTSYYCVFRGLWTKARQPADYPDLARFGTPVLYSSNKQFIPWIKDRATTWGIRKLAETGFTDTFHLEVTNAGEWVLDYIEADGFFVNNDDVEKNFVYFPKGVKVTQDYPFLSGISAIMPSPDWFTGFYMLNVIDEYDRTYWSRIKLQTYPWSSGTDAGTFYTDVDRPMDPPGNVVRITKANAPQGNIFVSADGTTIPPVSELECILHTCPAEEPDCVLENWPPVNGCDALKFPGCDQQCNPDVDQICQECKPKAGLDKGKKVVYYQNCCQSNYVPLSGDCNNAAAYAADGGSSATVASVGLLGATLLGIFTMISFDML